MYFIQGLIYIHTLLSSALHRVVLRPEATDFGWWCLHLPNCERTWSQALCEFVGFPMRLFCIKRFVVFMWNCQLKNLTSFLVQQLEYIFNVKKLSWPREVNTESLHRVVWKRCTRRALLPRWLGASLRCTVTQLGRARRRCAYRQWGAAARRATQSLTPSPAAAAAAAWQMGWPPDDLWLSTLRESRSWIPSSCSPSVSHVLPERMQDAGCWRRQRPDVFSEEEQWPPLEVFVGGNESLLDYNPVLQLHRC